MTEPSTTVTAHDAEGAPTTVKAQAAMAEMVTTEGEAETYDLIIPSSPE